MTPHDHNLCRFLFCEMVHAAGESGLDWKYLDDIFEFGVDGANQQTDDKDDDAMAEAFKAAVERYLREREVEQSAPCSHLMVAVQSPFDPTGHCEACGQIVPRPTA